MPTYKIINCHAGKLPFYRGRNILNWVLINDEKEFGITVHFIDESIDTGDIILQRTYNITDNDTYKTLLEKSYIECSNILYDAVNLFITNLVKPFPQRNIDSIGFYCSQRKVGDEIINWNQNSRELFNFVRAICLPGPIARSYINNKEIQINKINIIKNAPNYKGIPGAIIGKDNGTIIVKTLDNFIKIVEYEYDGNIRIGDRFEQ